MALARRRGGERMAGEIWPAFVDVLTSLLLVLMFVLSIFMVMQHFLNLKVKGQGADLEAQRAALAAQQEALNDAESASAAKTAEVDQLTQRLNALAQVLSVAQGEKTALQSSLDLSDAERARLANEKAAMDLALEEQRRKAEETLALLAAAEAAKEKLAVDQAALVTDAEKNASLLALAQKTLSEKEKLSADEQARVALLNEQLLALRGQLASVMTALDASEAKGATPEAKIHDLGARLNAALADKVDELSRYRSEFFGKVRAAVEGREGVKIVGDRFVFQSEVLFPAGSAEIGEKGKTEIAKVAAILKEVSDAIPPEVPWVLRIDGHSDKRPLAPGAKYKDNWELSQARALSVARFVIEREGFPPARVAATGFGEFQPLDTGDTQDAYDRNRRIELKLTER